MNVVGNDFSLTGLGLDNLSFGTSGDTQQSLTQIREAVQSLRDFQTETASYIEVIQSRESLMNSLVSINLEGADKLTLADKNAEGALLLTLQTRLQVSVTSLSLASQAQQGILRLFE